jgi:hypothetical protein
MSLGVAFALLYHRMWFQDDRAGNHIRDTKENTMNIEVNMAKKAIHDKLESEIEAAKAKLETLRAEAETAKADFEIKAITELLTKQHQILHNLREARK